MLDVGQLLGLSDSFWTTVQGNFLYLVVGLLLLALAWWVISTIGDLVVNSVTGLLCFSVLVFLLKVNIPFWPSLIASVLFGPAGVGFVLLLQFFGFLL